MKNPQKSGKGFKEQLAESLESISHTVPESQKHQWEKASQGFQGLFNNYLSARNNQVDWDKITAAKSAITPLSQIPELTLDEKKKTC